MIAGWVLLLIVPVVDFAVGYLGRGQVEWPQRWYAKWASRALGLLSLVFATIRAYLAKGSISADAALSLGVSGFVISVFLVFLAFIVAALAPGKVNVAADFIAVSFVLLASTGFISSPLVESLGAACQPEWANQQAECPFGSVTFFGDVTVPNVWFEGYPGESQFTVAVSLFYSSLFIWVSLLILLQIPYARWRPSAGKGFSLYRWVTPVPQKELWRIRWIQDAISLLVLFAISAMCKAALAKVLRFLLLIDPEQRWFYMTPRRPPKSCVKHCAMPNGQALWAYALLTYKFINLCFSWTAPILMMGEDPVYRAVELTWLGIRPLSTSEFFRDSLGWLLLLGPVPIARMLLSDAQPEQAVVGGVLGFLIAVAYHIGYVFLLKTQKRGPWLRNVIHKLASSCEVCGSTPTGAHSDDVEMQYRRGLLEDGGGSAGHGVDSTALEDLVEQPSVRLTKQIRVTVTEGAGLPCNGEYRLDEGLQSQDRPVYLQEGGACRLSYGGGAWQIENLYPQPRCFFRIRSNAMQPPVGSWNPAEGAGPPASVTRVRESHRSSWLPHGFEFLNVSTEETMDFHEQVQQQMHEATGQAREERIKREITLGLNACWQLLMAAMKTGDPRRLSNAITDFGPQVERYRQQAQNAGEAVVRCFESLRDIGDSFLRDAREKLKFWQIALQDFIDALEIAEKNVSRSPDNLAPDCARVYIAFLKAMDRGLDLRRAQAQAFERMQALLLQWPKQLLKEDVAEAPTQSFLDLLEKVVKLVTESKPEDFGNFCFADLDASLRIVRTAGGGRSGPTFVKVASTVVRFDPSRTEDDTNTKPKELRQLLEKLNDLIFFIMRLMEQKLDLTRQLFETMEAPDEDLMELVKGVCERYCGTSTGSCSPLTLLQREVLGKALEEPENVIRAIGDTSNEGLNEFYGFFKLIFEQMARKKYDKYKLIMVPNHVQVVALQVFKRFLETRLANETKTVIARVGTGQGKSMLIASLAAFAAQTLGKTVHVVGARNDLVLRDYQEFSDVFQALGLSHTVTSAAGTTGSGASESLWEHKIVYCTRRDVLTAYQQEAKGEGNFRRWDNALLLLDEVDSLVVDQDPFEHLLIPNVELSNYVAKVINALHAPPERRGEEDLSSFERAPEGDAPEELARGRIHGKVKRWLQASSREAFVKNCELTEDGYVLISRKTKQRLPEKVSNRLEVLNYWWKITNPEWRRPIHPPRWYDPLFVMSIPHVLSKYHRILGFSGTLGNSTEKQFIREAYKAVFFDVPEFLRTCQSPDGKTYFHQTEWSHLVKGRKVGWPSLFSPQPTRRDEKTSIAVMPDEAQQLEMMSQVCLRLRKHVPALVIATSERLAKAAQERLREDLGRDRAIDPDQIDAIVLPFHESLLQTDPRKYQNSLSASTQRIGHKKPWPITVTDHHGGRGIDYRMDDRDADDYGGLAVVVLGIPTSEREWIQFQGRTARQQCQGQIVAVLNGKDYDGTPVVTEWKRLGYIPGQTWLPDDVVAHQNRTKEVAQAVIAYGAQLSDDWIKEHRNGTMASMFANELCERFCMAPPCKLPSPIDAERLPFQEFIASYSTKTLEQMVTEVHRLRQAIIGPGRTLQALEVEIRERAPSKWDYKPRAVAEHQQALVFCLDWSGSMNCEVTEQGGPSRLEVCQDQIETLFRQQDPRDRRAFLKFGKLVHQTMGLQQWTAKQLIDKVRKQPWEEAEGLPVIQNFENGTCLYQTIAKGLEILQGAQEQQKWLIVLTDGEDGKETGWEQALETIEERLTQPSSPVNFVLITVGTTNLEQVREEFASLWQPAVQKGGKWCPIAADGAGDSQARITQAFEDLGRLIDDDVTGMEGA